MSQDIDRTDNPAPVRRSNREITLTQKAGLLLESGEGLPGISSPAQAPGVQEFNRSIDLQNPDRAAPVPRTMPVPTRTGPKPRPAAKSSTASTGADDHGLGRDKFFIYSWQYPPPKDFLKLSDACKRWKEAVDLKEKRDDIDDGADDWCDFDDELPDRAIASCFVKRAKRAFWAGRTWSQFEDEERNLNTQAPDADGKVDPEALDNERRMEIFGVIKRRLCEEIWLEALLDPTARRDSRSPAPNGPNGRHTIDPDLTPTVSERAEGIVAKTRNREGNVEPWYEGEKVNPNGIRNAIEGYRVDRIIAQRNQQQIRFQEWLQSTQRLRREGPSARDGNN